MELYAATQLVHRLLQEHNLQDCVFNLSRGKQTLGYASCNRITKVKTLSLSRYAIELGTEEEVTDTILHEIAHLLDSCEHGHNYIWRSICRRIGAKPERTAHTTKVPNARYTLTCSCGKVYRAYKAGKRMKMCSYGCGKCGTRGLIWVDTHTGSPLAQVRIPDFVSCFG